jgi:putative acyl-CoA dehydrogenase
VHHARHRKAFGELLINQPLMQNVLADLALESEAATLLMIRLARAFDRRATDPQERAFCRIATAISKFWLCKRSTMHVSEALECLGGNGYVEESIMPRLYREAPLNSIWEGSGNVICLDILRALSREPEAADALVQEIRSVAGTDKLMDRYVAEIGTDLEKQLKQSLKNQTTEIEGQARRLAERFALALQAVQVMRHSPPAIAEAFIASRLGGDHGQTFGTLPRGVDLETLLDRSGTL